MSQTALRAAGVLGGLVVVGISAGTAAGAGAVVSIGDSGTTASRLLADGDALALTAQGYSVTRVGYPDAFSADAAMRAGSVDVYVTDTATLLRRVLARSVERREARLGAALSAPLQARGQAVVAWAPADDAPAVTCSRKAMKRFGIGRLDRIASVSKNVVYAATPEHVVRADGLVALRAQFKRVLVTSGAARFTLLRRGKADCVLSSAAEPRVTGAAFLTLKDPSRRLAGTPAHPVTVASAHYLAGAPATFAPTVTSVAGRFTTPQLRTARGAVEVTGGSVTDVARTVLVAGGLPVQ